ncbi:MAG: stage 0 sporulation protein [Candidatus Binatia bacterium]|nr:stage 0 sporulation protein [Candidatus Binatia bacterium]
MSEPLTPPATADEETLPRLVGVKFHPVGPIHAYDPGALELRWGDAVVVATDDGQRLGVVTALPSNYELPAEPIRRVLRKATEADLDRDDRLHEQQQRAFRLCLTRILERDLPMKLVRVEQTPDGGRIVFYFYSEGRVDFRDLVRELAQALHTRIEMKQIGSREEAKMIGAMGPCGRELCCSTFLRNPGGVSVKMAKTQGLSLNPAKLAGMCGRLKCCLRYEYETYLELGRGLPAVGKKVMSLHGAGIVQRQNILKQTVLIQLEDGGALVEASLEDLIVAKTGEGESSPPSSSDPNGSETPPKPS